MAIMSKRLLTFSGLSFLIFSMPLIFAGLTAQAQQELHDTPKPLFPSEAYENYTPPLPNSQLNFKNDCSRSCCSGAHSDKDPNHYLKPDYLKDMKVSPFYLDRRDPAQVTPCEQLSTASPLRLDPMAQSQSAAVAPRYDIKSSSTRRTAIPYANFENRASDNGSFHVMAAGGMSRFDFKNVHFYSICAGRGDNNIEIRNTDNGGIHTHGGNNHILLAGNNTNQFTRMGNGGGNLVEIEHAVAINDPNQPKFRDQQWESNSIFRSGLSGGNGDDTVVLKNLPAGSKWCHIGDYALFEEQFHVVEFALPPSVLKGPRRQRINFGTSIDYVVVFGEKMTLIEFMENKPSNSKLCQPDKPPVVMMMQQPPKPQPKTPVIRGYW